MKKRKRKEREGQSRWKKEEEENRNTTKQCKKVTRFRRRGRKGMEEAMYLHCTTSSPKLSLSLFICYFTSPCKTRIAAKWNGKATLLNTQHTAKGHKTGLENAQYKTAAKQRQHKLWFHAQCCEKKREKKKREAQKITSTFEVPPTHWKLAKSAKYYHLNTDLHYYLWHDYYLHKTSSAAVRPNNK